MMRQGFTLLEILIVVTIFSMVALVATDAFLTSFKIDQQTNIENAILDDARFIMARLSREIQEGTIDYEEYFSQCVLSDGCPNRDLAGDPDTKEYGNNYGFYNWQFFYGGYSDVDDTSKHHGYGTVCQEDLTTYHEYPNPACVTGPLGFSEDYDTGVNPNPMLDEVSNADNATAFCFDGSPQSFISDGDHRIQDIPSALDCALGPAGSGELNIRDYRSFFFNELYLISADGIQKTIIGSEKVSDNDKVVSMVELIKDDQAKSASGTSLPLYGFTCAPGYNCTVDDPDISFTADYPTADNPLELPNRQDMYLVSNNIYDDFVPVSPLRVNVKNLQFHVGPPEDPRLAYAEVDAITGFPLEYTQLQPQVTIFLEVEPASGFTLPFLSERFNLKLQTTVTSGVLAEVPIVSEAE